MWAIALGICSGAWADLGNKLNLIIQNGSPKIGVQYSVGIDKRIFFSFSVQGNQLVGNSASAITPVYWAIADKPSGALITPWTDANESGAIVNPDFTHAFSFAISNTPSII